MAKIDEVEDLQNLMNDIVQSTSMQRFIEPPVVSSLQSKCNCYQYLFGCLKKEISKNLGIIDSYFQCMSEFYYFDSCSHLLNLMQLVYDNITDVLTDIQEGGKENA